LVTKVGDSFVQLGIVSWGSPFEPDPWAWDVGTNVSYYREWIEDNMRKIDDDSTDDDSTVSLKLSDKNRGILLASTDGGKGWGAICNDGLSSNVASLACTYLGYQHGHVVSPSQYWNTGNEIVFGATELDCPDNALSPSQCDWASYDEAEVPCYQGEAVALSCSDTIFNISTEHRVKTNKKLAKFVMMIEVEKYGSVIPLKAFTSVVTHIVDRSEEGEYNFDLSQSVKYKAKKSAYIGKVKREGTECLIMIIMIDNYNHTHVVILSCAYQITETQIKAELKTKMDED